MQEMEWSSFYSSIIRWIARYVTRQANAISRILAMNMGRKERDMNLKEEHSSVKI
jgi:hypothetical protein